MNILAIDTSNETMGIAIYQDNKITAEYISNNKNKHSIRLMPAIVQLMRDVDLTPKELTKIVVAKGPGSYTGVRIGLSTAKTMAWTLNIPVVGISSLETLALQARELGYAICPFFDARRGLVYTGLFQRAEDGLLTTVEEKNVLFEDWLEQLKDVNHKVVFLSPDIDQYRDLIIEILGDNAIIPEEIYHTARPSLLAVYGRYKEADNIHNLTPNYLRLVEAEAKWLEAQRTAKVENE
ncbi:tRNA threonylcarbamoyladenosine biosynthesis protein TsaB [Paraliobacillus quinghaiensis]|uniref:tRNA threonylcarbamoyladenosine biosynthesis protein TsaB n=1 Tax=Paraliobacillus quinghaiensis TaxID=470815 RepID=A0A917WXW4_9BACI|nr:tRNA (adenosine(37)-N6)-threonylcarbamoyltransferase complex dimerization subunit type 1 TsaB [Paraliobacillus quinghaiensis]GGM39592.1 tRNA threonylcarbamoyladenosine biosynthesis protein TsaB [Paraliobacillus quinghaiensis]